jgi:3-deoxy-D-manno-octulosonic-acid transferase
VIHLYNIFFLLGGSLVLPVLLAQALTIKKRRATVMKRLGVGFCAPRFSRRPIWIHALSVGEVFASVPMVQRIRERYTDRPLVFSVSTMTGNEIARKLLSSDVDHIFYFPYDFVWSVRRVVDGIDPAIFVLVESDIWPNILFELKKREIASVLVNGRMSPGSFSGYKALSFFMRWVFDTMSMICVQSPRDARLFQAVGAPADRITITGNIKFDLEVPAISNQELERLKQSMKIPAYRRILLAGSTHEGEETILLSVFAQLRKRFDDIVLLVVPRNPERASAVSNLFASSGWSTAMTGELKDIAPGVLFDVIVVDVMGMLRQLYALADISFVGGSLVKEGGHNPLEPAAFGKPIIFGPDMTDFPWVAEMLINSGGAVQVKGGDEFIEAATTLLTDGDRARLMGGQALSVFRSNKGAVDRTLEVVQQFLSP